MPKKQKKTRRRPPPKRCTSRRRRRSRVRGAARRRDELVKPTHIVSVVYKGFLWYLDEALNRIVGRHHDGGGFLFPKGERDLDWVFGNEAAAKRAYSALAKALQTRKEIPEQAPINIELTMRRLPPLRTTGVIERGPITFDAGQASLDGWEDHRIQRTIDALDQVWARFRPPYDPKGKLRRRRRRKKT